MASGYRWSNDNFGQNHPRNRGLLGAGWRPLYRELDWHYLLHLATDDPWELSQKTLDITSDIADALGRHQYAWWANILNVFSENMRYEFDEFWDYITPQHPAPDYRNKSVLATETPIAHSVDRNSIPIDYVLNRLQETTVLKILEILGKPDTITQYYVERSFYYPIERFTSLDRLEVLGTAYARWSDFKIWLQIETLGQERRRRYTLIAEDLTPWVNKATYNLAVILSGHQCRVGQVRSQFPIRSFPDSIQRFTDTVQQAILDDPQQLSVLVQGEPGTGKTAWTQAVATEILVPLGYVVFILDRDAVENFAPPSYLERICLIINEADNLARDRASDVAQQSLTTERILSLLDGTLSQSVVEDTRGQPRQNMVVLMTCNTTERLDPAMLRKGRVDLTQEFTYRFV